MPEALKSKNFNALTESYRIHLIPNLRYIFQVKVSSLVFVSAFYMHTKPYTDIDATGVAVPLQGTDT